LFDALKDLSTGVVRGANSDVLTAETLAEMARRREGLVLGVVPDRGHAPFLDEPEALTVIRAVLES
jgi:pimeloyl-ACP methyl ester carboxylesterase